MPVSYNFRMPSASLLPYMGELSANSLGFATTFDASTPISYFEQSMSKFQNFVGSGGTKDNPGYTKEDYISELYKQADAIGLDRKVAYSQISQESGFNPQARSPKGALGIAQFMPATAARYGLTDRTDPIESLKAYGKYMRDLLKMFGGNVQKAVAAYNWGEGNVSRAVKDYGDNWLMHAPGETRNYVSKIFGGGNEIDEELANELPGTKAVRGILGALGFNKESLDDFGMRVFLGLLAIVIIAAAVFSLR